MSGDHAQVDLELAAWIRAARRQAGLSQAELAEQLGIAQSSISQWEKSVTQPATPHLLVLLRMFPASVAELIASDGTAGDAAAAERSA